MSFPLAATGAWTVALVLGVGATVWQLAGDGPRRTPVGDVHVANAAKSGPQRMFGWEPTEATRVRLSSPSRVRDFRRSGTSAWEEVGEQGAPFDVDAYIGLFSRARIDRLFVSNSEIDRDLGLDRAELQVVVEAADGRILANVECGTTTPDGFGRYAQISGRSGVAIVPAYQFASALKAIDSVMR